MRYVFHCGAEFRHWKKLRKADVEKARSERKSSVRNGLMRIIVEWFGKKKAGPVHPDGTVSDCNLCPCKRKSGRGAFQYFPDDYKAEKDKKYKGKKFSSFCKRAYSCFPAKMVTEKEANTV